MPDKDEKTTQAGTREAHAGAETRQHMGKGMDKPAASQINQEAVRRSQAGRASDRDKEPASAEELFERDAAQAEELAGGAEHMLERQIAEAPPGKQADVPTADPSYQLPDKDNPVPQSERWMETDQGHRIMIPPGKEPPPIPDPAVVRDSGMPHLAGEFGFVSVADQNRGPAED